MNNSKFFKRHGGLQHYGKEKSFKSSNDITLLDKVFEVIKKITRFDCIDSENLGIELDTFFGKDKGYTVTMQLYGMAYVNLYITQNKTIIHVNTLGAVLYRVETTIDNINYKEIEEVLRKKKEIENENK
jgi:hypothetical protein